ncbi:MAG: gamma-glutamyltransferase [Beijerinckiaceae bacterium]|nr:gamma-glutamyltransferase [Beijerinckiaceae bacterium]
MTESQFFDKAACAAPHWAAAEAGRAVLAEGGNALEAMIAMAATIAVVYPHMNSIGGDGFWVIREPGGRVRYIEACGPAGRRATRERYHQLGHDTIPPRGPLSAVTIPGTIGGWALAQELSQNLGGRLPLADLLGAAVRFAREGTPVSPSEVRTVPFEAEALIQAPGYAETYLVDGKIPDVGSIRRFPALAATLAHLGQAGLDDFYRGDVGRELAADMDAIEAGGTRADLEAYRAIWREPLSLRLHGQTIYNGPPPTQGLASLIILGLFDQLGVKDPESFAHIHGLIEASKRALAIRDRVCTDFDQLRHAPEDFLTPEALAREAAMIDAKRAATLPIKAANGDTVWMGAIDASGLAVSFIQSIYWEYGSGCVLPRTGVLLQNRGISFSLDPHAVNPLTPGRRPTHTLNPALAELRDGRVVSYGSMGGDGQPQFQAQVLTRLLFGEGVAAAIDRPRFLFGKTWGTAVSSLRCEPRFDDGLITALRRAGHDVELASEPYSDTFGHAGALIRRADGRVEAGHDPRSDGGAAGI